MQSIPFPVSALALIGLTASQLRKINKAGAVPLDQKQLYCTTP